MLRATAVTVFFTILAAGCMSTSGPESTEGLPTGVALEAFAPKFPFGVAQSTEQIASSPNDVKTRLAQYARQCLDNKTTTTQRVSGLGMPVGGQLLRGYRASITNEDGIDRLIIAQRLGGAVMTNEAGLMSNVQYSMQILSDGAGGTTLRTTRNKTFFDLHAAALSWANGSSTSCPGIFAS